MKYPLDRICVKSELFCPSCQRKLDTGEVKPHEVDIIKTLMELEDRIVELRKGEYVKSYIVGDTVIIVLKGDWERSEIEKLSRDLSSKFGKRVRIVTLTSDQRLLVEQVLPSVSVLNINIAWLPDGSEQILVRIPSRDLRRLGNVKQWEEILTDLFQKPTRIMSS